MEGYKIIGFTESGQRVFHVGIVLIRERRRGIDWNRWVNEKGLRKLRD